MKKWMKYARPVLFQACFAFMLFLTFSVKWGIRTYGNLKFDEIVFHLNTTLEGAAGDLIGSYKKEALFPALLIWLVELFWVCFPKKNRVHLRFRLLRERIDLIVFPLRLSAFTWGMIFIIWTGSVLAVADRSFAMGEYMADQMKSSSFIEEHYVTADSVGITFPEKKRNLVMIYLESMETSLMDKASGGIMDVNYIPELTRLAENNTSFSQTDLLRGAHVSPGCTWTMAGLIAETAGLPLKKAGTHSEDSGEAITKDEQLAGAYTLGDILEDAGYKNIFMVGSSFSFAGRKIFFRNHGNYEIWDYNTAKEKGKIPEDYKVWWGYEDAKLFEYAKEKLLEIAENDEPFNLSLLTVDTHFPAGYVCEFCENRYPAQYGNVYACSSRQVNAFVEWIQQQDFYDDTTIVITGDHLSMDSAFFSDKIDRSYTSDTRHVYETFINAAAEPVNEKNRRFTTMDMFPTILNSLGVMIEGERLGLGTNLFSDVPTLSEEFGYEYLDDELSRKSNFYNNTLMTAH